MELTLSSLSYKSYVYLFDLKYFAKSIKDAGYDEKEIKNIVKDGETLYKHMLNAGSQKAEIDQYNILSEAFKLSESILNDLKVICCTDNFINEKTDLVVETFAIKEKTEALMNQILKNK